MKIKARQHSRVFLFHTIFIWHSAETLLECFDFNISQRPSPPIPGFDSKNGAACVADRVCKIFQITTLLKLAHQVYSQCKKYQR